MHQQYAGSISGNNFLQWTTTRSWHWECAIKLNLANNWWGTQNAEDIDNIITDYSDSDSLAYASYQPIPNSQENFPCQTAGAAFENQPEGRFFQHLVLIPVGYWTMGPRTAGERARTGAGDDVLHSDIPREVPLPEGRVATRSLPEEHLTAVVECQHMRSLDDGSVYCWGTITGGSSAMALLKTVEFLCKLASQTVHMQARFCRRNPRMRCSRKWLSILLG